MSTEQNIFSYSGTKRKIIIGLITVILIVMMFPKGESIESEVTEGAIWTNDDLIAPFSFPIIKKNKHTTLRFSMQKNLFIQYLILLKEKTVIHLKHLPHI